MQGGWVWVFVVVALACESKPSASADAASEAGLALADVARAMDAAAEVGEVGDLRDSGADRPDADPCVWGPSEGSVTAMLTNNNGVELQGPSLAKGSYAWPEQRKKVPVTVTVPLAGLEVGAAWLLRGSPSIESHFVVIPVRNVSAPFKCLIQGREYRWRSASGGEVSGTPKGVNLVGSIGGVNAGSYFTDTCLAPGETGYFTEIRIPPAGTKPFSDVVAIELAVTHMPGVPAPHKVLAQDFQAGTCARTPALGFRVHNQSPDLVELSAYLPGWAILLDEVGDPLVMSDLDGTDQPLPIAPGASLRLPTSLFYRPKAAKVHVYVDFNVDNRGARQTRDDTEITRILEDIAHDRQRQRDLRRSLPAAQ